MPIIEVPFSCIVMDIEGPLPNSSVGHQYLLVIIDYTTRFPEAIPMQSVIGPWMVEELMKWIMQEGMPKEIVTDQGSNFVRHHS